MHDCVQVFMLSVCMYVCVCMDTFICMYINMGMSVICMCVGKFM